MSDPLLLVAVGAILGLVLGLLGGGGGLLAVPALVALGEPIQVASTMSLVIVGTGAVAALIPHHRAGRVDWNVGLMFGALGSAGAIIGARAVQVASATVLLGGLAVMLLVGAFAMLRAARSAHRTLLPHPEQPVMAGGAPAPRLLAETAVPATLESGRTGRTRIVALASGVGLVTGFFGVGAGFVVVPALVSAMRVPIKRATATALVVIVINSAVALIVRHGHVGPLGVTAALAAATAVFAVVGAMVSHRIPGWLMSGAFGALMVAVAVFTVTRAVIGH